MHVCINCSFEHWDYSKKELYLRSQPLWLADTAHYSKHLIPDVKAIRLKIAILQSKTTVSNTA